MRIKIVVVVVVGISFVVNFFCRSEEHLPTYCRSDVVQFTVSDLLLLALLSLYFFIGLH